MYWDDSILRQNEGRPVRLGTGHITLRYRLEGHDRVRATFFLRDAGRVRVCGYDLGDAELLLRVLNAHAAGVGLEPRPRRGESELN